MEMIYFSFKDVQYQFTRQDLSSWLPAPLTNRIRIDFNRVDHQEAALDMMVANEVIDDRTSSLIEQMGVRQRAQLFQIDLVTDPAESE